MNNDFCFDLKNNKIYIKYIYGSITNITIENYLKRIEEIKVQKKLKNLEITIIPKSLVYSTDHLNWAIFITKHRILDKLNVSNDLNKEMLLTINCTDQLSKLEKLVNDKDYFICFISKKKISEKETSYFLFKNFLEKKITSKSFNKKEVIKKYNLKSQSGMSEIIEKMSQRSIK